MALLLAQYQQQFLIFVLVLTRIGTLVMTMPSFGGANVPMRVRAFLAVGISMLITPLHWGVEVESPANLAILTALLAKESLLGLAVGLTMHILLSGVHLAGHLMEQASGLSLAEVVNPDSEERVSIFMQLLEGTALSIFLLVGGHRWILDAVARSFHWMPPGKGQLPAEVPLALTEIVSQSFGIALRASAPVVLALLLATLIIGILSRTVPQINIMTLGLSVNSLLVLGALALCVGSIGWTFQESIEPAMEKILVAFGPEAESVAAPLP